MAYDAKLADRVRRAVARTRGVSEKPMFGGLCFLLDGKMFAGIVKDELMVRVGPERHAEAVTRPHARTMDFTGRPMKGYVFVAAPGVAGDAAVAEWVERGRAFVAGSILGKPSPRPPRAPSGSPAAARPARARTARAR